ncbi:MAG: hypothetical protein M3552_21125, partial [Planctomycetota bacterium]|nr:hypothetical protein [Planctomycetota bacterium]
FDPCGDERQLGVVATDAASAVQPANRGGKIVVAQGGSNASEAPGSREVETDRCGEAGDDGF